MDIDIKALKLSIFWALLFLAAITGAESNGITHLTGAGTPTLPGSAEMFALSLVGIVVSSIGFWNLWVAWVLLMGATFLAIGGFPFLTSQPPVPDHLKFLVPFAGPLLVLWGVVLTIALLERYQYRRSSP